MDIEHKECKPCGGSKLIIIRWLFLNLGFNDSIVKNSAEKGIV